MLSAFGMLTMLSTLSMITSDVFSTLSLLTVLRAMQCMINGPSSAMRQLCCLFLVFRYSLNDSIRDT